MDARTADYIDGYHMGRAGIPLGPHDNGGEEFVRGHENGMADHDAEVFGADSDMPSVGLVTI